MRLWPVILWLSLAVSAVAQHSRVPARAVDVGSWLSYTNIRTGTNTLDRFLQWIDANWKNLRGPTGPAGANGANGAGVEIVLLNDYGTNDAEHVWGLNFGLTDATWLNEVIIAAPRGPAGTDGVDGLAGADGAAGADGVDGVDGADAYNIVQVLATNVQWVADSVTGLQYDIVMYLDTEPFYTALAPFQITAPQGPPGVVYTNGTLHGDGCLNGTGGVWWSRAPYAVTNWVLLE